MGSGGNEKEDEENNASSKEFCALKENAENGNTSINCEEKIAVIEPPDGGFRVR